jgi:hypothetical protein
MHDGSLHNVEAPIPKSLEPPKFWVEHIPFVFYLIPKLKPSIIVELGTHSGNSFFAFCQAVKENNIHAKCYAVDTWQGDKHTGFYGEHVYTHVVKHLKENYDENAFLLRIRFDEALSRFEDKSIDLLHIDGLHTYEGVKHDFENWLPKLSEKGIVLFHDTQIKMKDFGVWKFWQELSKKYPSFEFYHGSGLGILVVGKFAPLAVLQFIDDANKNEELRRKFEREGRKVYGLYKKKRIKQNIKSIFSIHRIIARKIGIADR